MKTLPSSLHKSFKRLPKPLRDGNGGLANMNSKRYSDGSTAGSFITYLRMPGQTTHRAADRSNAHRPDARSALKSKALRHSAQRLRPLLHQPIPSRPALVSRHSQRRMKHPPRPLPRRCSLSQVTHLHHPLQPHQPRLPAQQPQLQLTILKSLLQAAAFSFSHHSFWVLLMPDRAWIATSSNESQVLTCR